MRKLAFLLPMVGAALMYSNVLLAATLETDNYIVEIHTHCEEGVVGCEDVTYKGTSKRSGNSIELKGREWHSICADGVTPCRFIGYIFESGNVTYAVYQDGTLKVTQGENILVEESGEWTY